MENQRNIILAVVLTAAVLFGSQYLIEYFYPAPPPKATAATEADATGNTASGVTPAPSADTGDILDAGTGTAATPTVKPVTVDTALETSQRVSIDNPLVKGSINLVGGRIDDLTLTDHREAIDKGSDPIRLFGPEGSDAQYFAQFGWLGQGVDRPTSETVWSADGETLTPDTPVTLSWTNATGQSFSIRYSIDENYLITATQSFTNSGEAPVTLQPISYVSRTSKTADPGTWIIRTGPIGVFDGAANFSWDYDDVSEATNKTAEPEGQVSWLGFSDIYWLSALIAGEGSEVEGRFVNTNGDLYRSDLLYEAQIVAPGATLETSTRLYAGAKNVELLDSYTEQGITLLDRAVDWGWFYWFEKPIFYLLKWLFDAIGNFGVAIILLVVIIRGLMFPIAQRQFASMAAMRAVQPKMKALQEKYKDDKAKMQQEVMKLYKEEKVNPLGGCLPIFLQIPIFFALYKVLLLTVEMRHQPFALWIKDLSAPDPLTPVNLFGLLPFEPVSFLAIGILPILLGISMWLQFKLNPAPTDPVQAQVFSIMPWILMFVMAPFAAGLQLYWMVSNVLTIAQQKWFYSRHPQMKEMMAKEAEEKARKKELEAAKK
ncbi:MAG: membrane protein insertase YidC [Pseudomonadota bacterium]